MTPQLLRSALIGIANDAAQGKIPACTSLTTGVAAILVELAEHVYSDHGGMMMDNSSIATPRGLTATCAQNTDRITTLGALRVRGSMPNMGTFLAADTGPEKPRCTTVNGDETDGQGECRGWPKLQQD